MTKIQSAGDGHYLYLQTQFSEDRCTQFRVIVLTDPQTHTHPQTDRTNYNTLRCTASVEYNVSVYVIEYFWPEKGHVPKLSWIGPVCNAIKVVQHQMHFKLLKY